MEKETQVSSEVRPRRHMKFTTQALFQMFGPFRETVQRDGLRVAKVLLSAFMLAFSVNVFLEPAGMLSAGFGGVSLLIQRVVRAFLGVEVPFSALNLALNAIPAIAAFFIVGRKFFVFSLISIVAFSFFVDWLPSFAFVDDIFLNTVLAAVVGGVASAIALNANASGGGTDFIAMIFSTKFNIAVWNYVFLFNVLILTISGVLFGAKPALYSILYQFGSTQILNRLHNRYQRKTVFLITSAVEPITTDLRNLTHHGVTVFEGIGSYSMQTRYLLYMVVSKTDIALIKRYLKETHQEDKVFMNIGESESLEGRFYMEPME